MAPEPTAPRNLPTAVTAIDIVFDLDQTMLHHARAANAALLKNFPQDFALDETHHPHISIFAGFVPRGDLSKVYEAAGKILAQKEFKNWRLTAHKYYYVPMGLLGLAGIVVEPIPALVLLQREMIEAITPYSVPTATAAAFYTTPAEPDIEPSVIEYIATSMEKHSGEHYSPHVTNGIGTAAFLDEMLAAPFADFSFSPAGASVFQFVNYGAARKRLKAFSENA